MNGVPDLTQVEESFWTTHRPLKFPKETHLRPAETGFEVKFWVMEAPTGFFAPR